MAATEWAVPHEQSLVGAYVKGHALDGWFEQSAYPATETPLSRWLMNQVGYAVPPRPHTVYPPTSGRGYPRGTT